MCTNDKRRILYVWSLFNCSAMGSMLSLTLHTCDNIHWIRKKNKKQTPKFATNSKIYVFIIVVFFLYILRTPTGNLWKDKFNGFCCLWPYAMPVNLRTTNDWWWCQRVVQLHFNRWNINIHNMLQIERAMHIGCMHSTRIHTTTILQRNGAADMSAIW